MEAFYWFFMTSHFMWCHKKSIKCFTKVLMCPLNFLEFLLNLLAKFICKGTRERDCNGMIRVKVLCCQTRYIFHLYLFYFFDSNCQDFQVPRSPKFCICRSPDFQTPPPAPPPPPNDLSDPNLTPLPTRPGINYVARTLAVTWRQLATSRHGIQTPDASQLLTLS